MSKKTKDRYPPDSLADLMSTSVPVCKANDSYEDMIRILFEKPLDDLNYMFVVDDDKKLLGLIELPQLRKSDKNKKSETLMTKVELALKPEEKRNNAIMYAIKYDTDTVPIVDQENHFLGAIVSKTLIDIMHDEHLENMFYKSGIYRKTEITKLAAEGVWEVVKSRVPWLILGLFAGLGLGLISSYFEQLLEKNIALAFFIPVVAYIADSVGTQSEAIAVRALAMLKINNTIYLLRELFIGLVLGALMGCLGGLGAALITFNAQIGFVVGFSLFSASTISSVVASAIPILFKIFGKDPALGSGPLSTAAQDVISVIIYFLFALWLL